MTLQDLEDARKSNFVFEFGGSGNLSDRSTTSATDNDGESHSVSKPKKKTDENGPVHEGSRHQGKFFYRWQPGVAANLANKRRKRRDQMAANIRGNSEEEDEELSDFSSDDEHDQHKLDEYLQQIYYETYCWFEERAR